MKRLFSFPDPVNEVAARTVAGFVVVMALAVIGGLRWVLFPLAFGFVARVLTGPTLSPLGQLATRVIVPRLPFEPRPTPGPPKRFAQGMGATMAVAAVVAEFVFHNSVVATVLAAMIVVAATLESVFGYCLGCKVFGLLMRTGIIPEAVCEACSDISRRKLTAA